MSVVNGNNRSAARLVNVRGQSAAEYLIIVLLIALTVIVSIRYFGGSIKDQLEGAKDQIEHAQFKEEAGSAQKQRSLRDPVTDKKSFQPEIVQSEPKQSQVITPLKGVRAKTEKPQREEELSAEVSRLAKRVGDDHESEAPVRSFGLDTWVVPIAGIVFMLLAVAVALTLGKKKKKRKKFSLNSEDAKESRGDNSESGQVLVIGAFIILALAMISITVANVGMMVAEKIQLQDTVDASAYSAAVVQARYLNLNSYINRAMVANYDSMAFNTALWSTVASHDHGSAIVTSVLYQVTALIEVLSLGIATGIAMDLDMLADTFRDYVHSPLHDFNQNLDNLFAQDEGKQDLNQYLESYNTDFLSLYQGLLYAAAQSARHDVIKAVSAKMDRRTVMTSVLGLGAEAVSYDELARAVDYVVHTPSRRDDFFGELSDRFDEMSGDEDYSDKIYLLGAITEASLDSFTAGRDRLGNTNKLRQFDPIADLLEEIIWPVEAALEGACEALTLSLGDCDTHINLDLGSVIREGQEDEADQVHVPIIANQRMREVNGWIFGLDIEGFPGVSQILSFMVGNQGYTSGDRRNDVANAANVTITTEKGFAGFERAAESVLAGSFTSNPLSMPLRGLNVINMFLASEMGVEFPLFCDDHWDGTYDPKPVNFFEIFPPGPGQLEGARYTAEVYSNWKTEDGIPNYDWKVNLDDVGFFSYHYPTDGAVLRPNETSGGPWENYLSGPSLAVVGVKNSRDLQGLKGLGIGNEYSMTAIARSQVYYLRNPNRPWERPSLFNPHWVARLAPIDSDDTPVLLRDGLPYLASLGITVRPTH